MKRPLSIHLDDVLVSSYATTAAAGRHDVSSKVAQQDFRFTPTISKASPATMVAMASEPAAGGDNADVVPRFDAFGQPARAPLMHADAAALPPRRHARSLSRVLMLGLAPYSSEPIDSCPTTERGGNSMASTAPMYRFGPFEVRLAERRLLADGMDVPLGARAFDMLRVLIERRDRVVGAAELFDLVWPGLVVEENNVRQQVAALRKVLGAQAIATVPGRGYRFAVPLHADNASALVQTDATSQAGADVPGTSWSNLPAPTSPAGAVLPTAAPRRASIAVMPFVDRIAASNAHGGLADGLVHDIITRLAKLRSLFVIAQGSVFALDERRIGPQEAGRALNVDYVLKPAPVAQALELRARIVEHGERKSVVACSVRQGSVECATAEVITVRVKGQS